MCDLWQFFSLSFQHSLVILFPSLLKVISNKVFVSCPVLLLYKVFLVSGWVCLFSIQVSLSIILLMIWSKPEIFSFFYTFHSNLWTFMVSQISIMSLDCLYFSFLCFASLLPSLIYPCPDSLPCPWLIQRVRIFPEFPTQLLSSVWSSHGWGTFRVTSSSLLKFSSIFLSLHCTQASNPSFSFTCIFFRHHSDTHCCVFSIHWALLVCSLNALPSLIMFVIISNLCPCFIWVLILIGG